MPTIDFSLNNPLIKGFFEGTSTYVPSSELIYVHTHMLQSDFLSQIETMISKVDQYLAENPKKSNKLAVKILNITEQLGQILPKVDESTAKQILYLLKDMYQICNKVLAEIPDPTLPQPSGQTLPQTSAQTQLQT